jgi:hypothetical protein
VGSVPPRHTCATDERNQEIADRLGALLTVGISTRQRPTTRHIFNADRLLATSRSRVPSTGTASTTSSASSFIE